MSTSVGIVGVSGLGGGELVRYLSRHPEFRVTSAYGETSAGRSLGDLFPCISGTREAKVVVENWSGSLSAEAELLFLSLPTGKSREAAVKIPDNVRVVDLGGDHRFVEGWTYSLPEVMGQNHLRHVMRLANPGCYPTAVMLALAPLFEHPDFYPEQIIINANSGLSGMGRGSKDSSGFSDLNEDAWTYKIFGHPHIPEIRGAIGMMLNKTSVPQIIFVPQCVPMTRGISAVIVMKGQEADYNDIASRYYERSPFVRVVKEPPHTKWTSGTNLAYVSYASSAAEETIIALAAIDNLGKGAAGQAIQNANLMFGFSEQRGLDVLPLWP